MIAMLLIIYTSIMIYMYFVTRVDLFFNVMIYCVREYYYACLKYNKYSECIPYCKVNTVSCVNTVPYWSGNRITFIVVISYIYVCNSSTIKGAVYTTSSL